MVNQKFVMSDMIPDMNDNVIVINTVICDINGIVLFWTVWLFE